MHEDIWTIGRLLEWTTQYFQSKGIASPRLDGEVLLSHVLKVDRIYCYSHYDKPLTKEELGSFKKLLLARVEGRSVAAITGHKEFMGLSFQVNEHVLIPRADTETVVEGVLSLCDKKDVLRIVDVCTGPGTILLSLLHYLPNASGVGVDISEKALLVAKENQKRFHLMDRSSLHVMDVLQEEAFPKDLDFDNVDVMTANPPYIRTDEMKTLMKEVLFEPHIALDGGRDGLMFYPPIFKLAKKYLKRGGLLAVEFGLGQEEAVANIADKVEGFSKGAFWKDISGKIRCLAFTKE